jgi:hypothetical protein
MHNGLGITQRLLCASWSNEVKPFQLASPMQWKHVNFTARVSRCFHCVENIWSFSRGTTLWSIWIECNDLVFNNARWDRCSRIHKMIGKFDHEPTTYVDHKVYEWEGWFLQFPLLPFWSRHNISLPISKREIHGCKVK